MQKKLTIKIVTIAFIAIFLMIPLEMISGKIDERAFYLEQAKQSVSDSWTASQVVLPTLLVLPYEIHRTVSVTDSVTKKIKTQIQTSNDYKLVVPDKLMLSTTIDNSMRHKGIYNVPVYTSKIHVSGVFNGKKINKYKKQISEQHEKVVFKSPYLSAVVSDPRGINSIPVLEWQNKTFTFKPSSRLPQKYAGIHANLPSINEEGINNFSYLLELRGMEQLSFIPVGLENELVVKSSWPHPQFVGDFLPTSSEISAQGYSSKWHINSFANNIEDKVLSCENNSCDALFNGSLGIKHIETVDVYLQSERTVKYGMLFIGLCFITFFIFETLVKLPIHPIQYCLVGLANAIFYLLLISLSENIQFGLAYAIASFCCVALLMFYLKPVLKEKKYAYIFSSVLAALYSVLYIIINMEDLALMMGSFLIFFVLAAIMFTTRNIDWYQMSNELSNSTVNNNKNHE
jgi:inner membrane protein